MKNKIMDAYFELRDKYYAHDSWDGRYDKDNMQVVITISPKAYHELKAEAYDLIEYINTNYIDEIHFINLCGEKTPIIIDNTLPENVEFAIQYRKDYERIEKEKMMQRFIKMFNS